MSEKAPSLGFAVEALPAGVGAFGIELEEGVAAFSGRVGAFAAGLLSTFALGLGALSAEISIVHCQL